MGTDCPLRVLGLPEGATSDEIRRAFRSLARHHHPDLGGDRTRFQEIRAAFEALRRSGRVTDKPAVVAAPRGGVNRYQTWMRELDAAAVLTPEMFIAVQPSRRSTSMVPSARQSDRARQFAAIFERELAAVS